MDRHKEAILMQYLIDCFSAIKALSNTPRVNELCVKGILKSIQLSEELNLCEHREVIKDRQIETIN